MDTNTQIIAFGAIFFGTLVSLVAYDVIGKNFKSEAYHNWLASRRRYFRVLGPILTILGLIYLFSYKF